MDMLWLPQITLTQELRGLVAITLLSMVVDVVLGVLSATLKREVRSSKMREGVARKAYLIIVGMVIILLDGVLGNQFAVSFGDARYSVGELYIAGVLIAELQSILEKGEPLGIKWGLPLKVLQHIADSITRRYGGGGKDDGNQS
jgi:toxin secretion/phage lysis holin